MIYAPEKSGRASWRLSEDLRYRNSLGIIDSMTLRFFNSVEMGEEAIAVLAPALTEDVNSMRAAVRYLLLIKRPSP